jgi:hypothetical protein
MSKYLGDIRQAVRETLQDTFVTGSVPLWADPELDQAIETALAELSLVSPRQLIVTAEGDGTKKIDLNDITDTAFDMTQLLKVNRAEYPVDEDPEEFKNVTRFGDIITINVSSAPTDGDDVYLYCDMMHILTESESSLTPVLEALLIIGASGIASSSKPMKLYQQANGSVDTLTSSTTALSDMTARLTLAITDIGSARVEVAKVPAIITTSAGIISGMTARIALAITDIADGRVELDKVPAIIDIAHTELDKIAGAITLATSAIATSKTELDKITTEIGSADTALDKIDAEVLQAVTDLDSGRALIAGIDTTNSASKYQGYAQAGVGNANGYLNEASGFFRKATALESESSGYIGNAHGSIATAQTLLSEAIGYIRQGGADREIASGYMASANTEIRTAGELLSQANGYMAQARAEESSGSAMCNLASHEISLANADIGKASAYLRVISSKLSIASAGRTMEAWGNSQKAEFRGKLRRLSTPRNNSVYPA